MNFDAKTPLGQHALDTAPLRLPAAGGRLRPACFTPRASQGVALVITLIMLSVITFMAVTFLVLSHRQRGSVTTTTDQAEARFAAETARERAQAEIVSRMRAFTNDQNLDLTVTTNFINAAGFDPTVVDPQANLANINYDHTTPPWKPLTADQVRQVLTNLLYNPRPPVFVTNRSVPNSQEFRFYLDLNRNSRYDTNGYLPAISPDPGNPYYNATNGALMAVPTAGITVSNFFVGDPEWIGVLEYPDRPHSANNRFIARYAYLVSPAGKTLDVNYIHNEAALIPPSVTDYSFRRNMGVGTWEINLAAFLADLNTNQWYPNDSLAYYNYLPLVRQNPYARGYAFQDANSILNYRYGPGGWNNLLSLYQSFGQAAIFQNDLIDEFGGGGPLTSYMTGVGLPATDGDIGRLKAAGWPGADNPNHFFQPGDFYHPEIISPAFVTNRLLSAGLTNSLYANSTNSSYDCYTFYRMLAQLGSDSTPERDKIDVNYRNVANGVISPGLETNLYVWNANDFFTNAANKLLRAYTANWFNASHSNFFGTYGMTNAFGVTNIPVYMTGSFTETNVIAGITNVYTHYSTNRFTYTPSIHRILQLTANIFDAADTNGVLPLPNGPNVTNSIRAPTVWRPIFRRNLGAVATNVFIVGYVEVPQGALNLRGANLQRLLGAGAYPMVDLDNSADRFSIPQLGTPYKGNQNEVMVYGIPMVVGAKKGLPNFNKFALQNAVTVTRKLNFHRNGTGKSATFNTNQNFLLNITNSFGVQAWNSYSNAFTRNVQMIVVGDVALALTNEFGKILYSSNSFTSGFPLSNDIAFSTSTNFAGWPGFGKAAISSSAYSFVVPLLTNDWFLPNWSFLHDQNLFVLPATLETKNYFPVPHWMLTLKTRLRYILIDSAAGRILDYVNLSSSEDPLDIMSQMSGGAQTADYLSLPQSYPLNPGSLWSTNRLGNPNPSGPPVPDNPYLPTYGIINQIEVSEGQLSSPGQLSSQARDDNLWTSYRWTDQTTEDKPASIRDFESRLFGDGRKSNNPDDIDFSAGYNPSRTLYQYVRWEANDPLVHYTVPDLIDLLSGNTNIQMDANTGLPGNPVARLSGQSGQIGQSRPNPLADHYRPWYGNPVNILQDSTNVLASITKVNTAVKDPLVTRSDDWDFPTNKLPNIGWLGRVHRGTPWQTVYLKSSPIDSPTWTNWSGNNSLKVYTTEWSQLSGNSSKSWRTNATDMDTTSSMPVNDRLLFDVFTTALNDNATHGQLSVNQTNLAAWSAVLSGVITLTNVSSATDLGQIPPILRYNPLVVGPAGIYNPFLPPAQQPPVVRIWRGINNARLLSVTNAGIVSPLFPNQVFNHEGDILATPELTVNSPFLNTTALASQAAGGINDEVLERIPQQIMGLLTLSHTPRFVVYSYGQALHPADRSLYTGSGPFFNLCTNYQVTAETAMRAVVRVEGSFDPQYTAQNPDQYGNYYPPHVVVEQFNVLPPD
jgi:hypothetical protein